MLKFPRRKRPQQSAPLTKSDKPVRPAVIGDNPIEREEDDALGRTRLAAHFAEQLRFVDRRSGSVVGVLGPWGSGKTSLINLVKRRLQHASITVLNFNPWMFSGTSQLLDAFFIELASQLKLRPELPGIGEALDDYAEGFSGLVWLPVVGPWLERSRGAAKMFGTLLQRRKEGISGRRAKLEAALEQLEDPIVIVIDDIDRLTTPEIRDIFKLVRLTASFPNVVYLLAFDRQRVERALSEEGIRGRDYLEKILQLHLDLPAIPDRVLNAQIFSALNEALDGLEGMLPVDHANWSDIFFEMVRPLIRHMRDVRRYAAAVRISVVDVGSEITMSDVLGLEAIRTFLPDVFARLHLLVEPLTSLPDRSFSGSSADKAHKAEIADLINAAGENGEIVRAMITRLFPSALRHIGGANYGIDWEATWLRDRRVAHSAVLRYYLERVAGEELTSFTDAERAFSLMSDAAAFERFLKALEPVRMESVIAALESFEEKFRPDHVVPGVIVLLNLLPLIPDRERGMFEMSTKMVVSRVTYRLVRSLNDPEKIEATVRTILPNVSTLSSKMDLIYQVGHQENVGHELISIEGAKDLEVCWALEVSAARGSDLSGERELLKLLWSARKHLPEGTELTLPETAEFAMALLRSSRSDTLSQSANSRTVQRFPRLAWDVLAEVAEGEEHLRDLVRIAVPLDEDDTRTIELANRYLGGWHPDSWRDDDEDILA